MIVEVRSLTLLEGMSGVTWNGAPVWSGPSLTVDENGVEWVEIITVTGPVWESSNDARILPAGAGTRYLYRADMNVDIGEVDPWLPA